MIHLKLYLHKKKADNRLIPLLIYGTACLCLAITLSLCFNIQDALSQTAPAASKKPGGATNLVLDEISEHLNEIIINIKTLGDYPASKNWPEFSKSDEVKISDELKKELSNLKAEYSKTRSSFEVLYRDFISLNIKNELLKKSETANNNENLLFKNFSEFENIDLTKLSYEINLLETTLNSKLAEKKLIQSEMQKISENQQKLLNVIAESKSAAGTLENLINAKNYSKDNSEFILNSYKVIESAQNTLNLKMLRHLELKLYSMNLTEKFLTREIAKTQSEYDQKKQLDKFLKDNNLNSYGRRKSSQQSATKENQISGGMAQNIFNNSNLAHTEEYDKKIKSLIEEIKSAAAQSASAETIHAKFSELKLHLENELLNYKRAAALENEELAQYKVKISNFSEEVAREDAESLKTIYNFINLSGTPANHASLKQEIQKYKKISEENRSLINYINSDQKKIETLLNMLKAETANKDNVSVYAANKLKEKLAVKDLEHLKELFANITDTLGKRTKNLENYYESLKKYKDLASQRIKIIRNVSKVLTNQLNEYEGKLQLKTFTESYDFLIDSLKKLYSQLESLPSSVSDIINNKNNFYAMLNYLKYLIISISAVFLSYKASLNIFSKHKFLNGYKIFTIEFLKYAIEFVAAAFFISMTFPETIWRLIITLVAIILMFYKVMTEVILKAYFKSNMRDDIYFRISLFLKYFTVLTVFFILITNLSPSIHFIILFKFLYKFSMLILLIILARKYRHSILSFFYISKHRLSANNYSEWTIHLADLYNYVLKKYHNIIIIAAATTLTMLFAGYYDQAFYVFNSSLLTFLLYSVLYLAPKFSMMTVEWVFSDDDKKSLSTLNSYINFRENAVKYIRIFYRIFFVAIFIIFALKIWGFKMHYIISLFTSDIVLMFVKKILTIFSILLVAFLCWSLISHIADDIIKNMFSQNKSENLKKRGITMAPLIKSSAKYIIWFFAIYLVLKELGIDATPIVAGAGILGLAVGFGSQNLVRDLVSGFFIIFEDQYNVDDYIIVEGIEGTVEEISIRITKIRDVFGSLHIIPNGAITKVTNFSKDFSVSRLEIPIAYESNIDKTLELINTISGALCQDWNLFIIEKTKVIGIIKLGDSEIIIRTQTKLSVGKRLDFECEFRKKILEEFKKAGIEIPYKKMVIYEDQVFHKE